MERIKRKHHGKTYSIGENRWGNWFGYIGSIRIEMFCNTIPGYGAEQQARELLDTFAPTHDTKNKGDR